jgi:hypothetical protein
MNALLAVFENLTAPQAEVISSATTLLSALLVALVAPLTFHLLTRRGVKGFHEAVGDLKIAAESAQAQSQTIRDSMGTVRDVSSKVGDLGVLIASVQEALANTQNTLLEDRAQPTTDHSALSSRERIKGLWRGLQELVERMASRPRINGNTRAKYARIDRRGYLRLIATVLEDGHLAGSIDDWKDAYYLWMSARQASAEPTVAELQRMQSLDRQLREANSFGDALVEVPALQQPILSPGVLMTPRNVEAETPRDQARSAFAKAPHITKEGGSEGERPPA